MKESMFNTPPVFPVYASLLTLQHLENNGGIAEAEKRNEAKAKLLYDEIDSNPLFECFCVKEDRSLMNITFRLPSEEPENLFISEAKKNGMIGLKGHRDVGGCRASCYNALPLTAAYDLAAFMKNFQKQNGYFILDKTLTIKNCCSILMDATAVKVV